MDRVFSYKAMNVEGREKMNQRVFSIFDSKAEAFLQPFFATTKGVAIRQFSGAVNQDGHELNKFTLDYQLFELGEFDEHTGKLIPHETPRPVVSANDVKDKEIAT